MVIIQSDGADRGGRDGGRGDFRKNLFKDKSDLVNWFRRRSIVINELLVTVHLKY